MKKFLRVSVFMLVLFPRFYKCTHNTQDARLLTQRQKLLSPAGKPALRFMLRPLEERKPHPIL